MSREDEFTAMRALRELYCQVRTGGAPCHVWAAIEREEKALPNGKRSELRRFCAQHCDAYDYAQVMDKGNFEVRRKVGRKAFARK
jgi:hypothetical protein